MLCEFCKKASKFKATLSQNVEVFQEHATHVKANTNENNNFRCEECKQNINQSPIQIKIKEEVMEKPTTIFKQESPDCDQISQGSSFLIQSDLPDIKHFNKKDSQPCNTSSTTYSFEITDVVIKEEPQLTQEELNQFMPNPLESNDVEIKNEFVVRTIDGLVGGGCCKDESFDSDNSGNANRVINESIEEESYSGNWSSSNEYLPSDLDTEDEPNLSGNCSETLSDYDNSESPSECDQKFSQKHVLKFHYERKHNGKVHEQKHKTRRRFFQKKIKTEKDELQEHYKLEMDFFICLLCPPEITQKFRVRSLVRSHIKVEHYRLRLICSECNAEYKRRDKIIQHYKNYHKQCSIPNEFKTTMLSSPLNILNESRIKNHQRTPLFNYKNTYQKLDDSSYICLLCPKDDQRKFKTCDSTNHHVKYTHFNLRYICTECGWKTTGQRELRRHYKTKHDMEPPLKLETTSSIHRSIYEDMYKNEQDAPVNEKEEQFKNLIFSKEHYRRDDKIYVCLLCATENSQKFPRKQHLGHHIKIDHFRFRIICSECGSEYKCRYALVQHYKSHHKDCTVPEELQTTVLEQPQVDCNIVKPLKAPDNYEKLEDDSYNCTICLLKCRSLNSVRNHIKKEHLGHRFKCELCPKEYRSIGSLKYHLRANHSGGADGNIATTASTSKNAGAKKNFNYPVSKNRSKVGSKKYLNSVNKK